MKPNQSPMAAKKAKGGKAAAKKTAAKDKRKEPPMDPYWEALFEASYARNREAIEALAKL